MLERMKRPAILGTIVAAWLAVACFGAQRQEALTIQRLTDNLFVIAGNGGNSAVFIHASGVVLVDTKFAGTGQRLLDQIKTVTDKAVTHIINTHSHFDHVGSNGFFPSHVEVIAHENAAGQMPAREEFADPAAKHGLPDRTFKLTMTLLAGDDAIDLHYFGVAHTNGDAFVVFRKPRVLHAGDTFPGLNPVTRDGGSAEPYPATMSRAATLSGIDTVIPGHGPTATWQQFVDNARSLARR